ncbi:MAG: hypothetical protein RLZZ543_1706, partial [Bacteroidota bacterium]
MSIKQHTFTGLSAEQVEKARIDFGANILKSQEKNQWWSTIKRIFSDPMLLLLLTAASIYFISGKTGDALFLVAAIVFQTSISLYQYSRSKNALDKLKDFTQAGSKVIRDGKTIELKSEEVVVGDVLIVEEGVLIQADAVLLQSNDFSVNESILTGES